MTATLTLQIPSGNVGDLDLFFELGRAGLYPKDAVTYFADPPRIVLEVDSEVVTFLLEQLALSIDMKNAQSLVEWRAARADQYQLPIDELPQSEF